MQLYNDMCKKYCCINEFISHSIFFLGDTSGVSKRHRIHLPENSNSTSFIEWEEDEIPRSACQIFFMYAVFFYVHQLVCSTGFQSLI